MQERVAYAKVAPGTITAMRALDQYVTQSGLEPGLLDLVKIRASQLNGCAYCVDMHTKDARARGEGEQRLYALPVWHENAVLLGSRAGCAGLDRSHHLPGHGVTDELYHGARQHFSKKLSTAFASGAGQCRHRPRGSISASRKSSARSRT